MATIVRQPFAPLNEARLQTLTSLKNRQNAISNTSPSKRKASDVTASENLENVDPVSFSKRAKGTDGFFPAKEAFIKPPTFFLSKPTKELSAVNSLKAAAPRSRSLLNPKSPSAQRDANISRPSLPAPVARVSTRKRSGLVSSRKRTSGSFTRIDPPVFGHRASSSVAPFSLDAALKGTIASYSGREDISSQLSSGASSFRGLNEPEVKSSWFFEIHEDTEAEEAANMLQHGACTLDISSDEECEQRQQRERAEGKENLPPADDVSQTSYPRAARHAPQVEEMVYEKERSPLGEMDPKQYYSEGCDENSIIIVPGDEDDTAAEDDFSFAPNVNLEEPELAEEETPVSAEELMQKTDDFAPSAADESFEVWESSSAKDEAEAEAEAAVDCC